MIVKRIRYTITVAGVVALFSTLSAFTFLVCPVTHGPLDYDRERAELISRGAKLAYPVRDGVPIMLPEEARELAD